MSEMLWGAVGFLVTGVPLTWGGRRFMRKRRAIRLQHQALQAYRNWAISRLVDAELVYDVPPSTKREDLEPWLEQ